MIKIYQKQPIQAEQFDGSQKYISGHKVISDNSLVDALTHDPVYYSILIDEDDPDEEPDEVIFEIGDWVIKDGEDVYAIDDDTFKSKYDELPVIPKAVADWIELGKSKRVSLDTALLLTLYENKKTDGNELARWIMHGNLATVARAWLDGYQAEAQHDTRTD